MENIIRNLRLNHLDADVLLLEQTFNDYETLFQFVTELGRERSVNELVGRYLFTRGAAEIVCNMTARN